MREIQSPKDLEPGDVVDGWRVVRELGAGGMGRVLLVERDGERLAMKFAHWRRGDGAAAQVEARAWKEIVCLMQMDGHPNIRKVYGFGRWPRMESGWLYVLLEYVDGETLETWTRRTNATARELVLLFEKVAAALERAHQHGLFNRDIKPDNILVRNQGGEPVIADWNTGQYAMAVELTEGPVPPGTWRYRSPEARAFERDHRNKPGAHYEFKPTDDLYSLGATMYDVLASGAPNPEGIAVALDQANPSVPGVLCDVVRKLMAQDPRHRYATAEALRRDLRRLAELKGPEWDVPLPRPGASRDVPPSSGRGVRRGARKLGALAVGTLVLTVGGVWVTSAGRPAPPVAEAPVAPPLLPHAPVISEAPSGVPAAPPASSKEPPPVKPSTPTSARSAPASNAPLRKPTSQAEFANMCRALAGGALAFQMGCAGAQLRLEPGECPREAIEAMQGRLGLELPVRIMTAFDETNTSEYGHEFKEGPITGFVFVGIGKLPEKTRLKGHVWLKYGWVLARYNEAILPNGDKLPVCMVAGDPRMEGIGMIDEKDRTVGTVGVATAVRRWPEVEPRDD